MHRIIILFKRTSFWIFFKIMLNHLTMKLLNKNTKISYSQFAEDIILLNLFADKNNGTFVDVGCNRPIDGNNTFNLYIRGWNGLNIDGNQNLINEYKYTRPMDTSICALVSNKEVEVPFYISKTDKVSTINKEVLEKFKKQWEYSENDIIYKKTKTLTQILDENNYTNRTIDLLSIDIEGHDYEALLGLDFNKYRPRVICIEIHDFAYSNLQKNEIVKYLSDNNYKLNNFAILNGFFVDNNLVQN